MALPSLTINGLWTMETRKAMQRHLKAKGYYVYNIDGDFGVDSKKGLQRLLKEYGWYSRAIDGAFGYYSNYALFKFLSVTWGSGNYLSRTSQSQYYTAPWMPWTASDELFVKEVTRAMQSGLNRHGTY